MVEKLNSRTRNKAESQLRKDLDQMRLTAGKVAGQSDGLLGYDDYRHSFGDELRGRRASMGKGLLDVQKELGIKPWIIVSIEKADPKSFDSPWMIAPLVKSYARYLGMDADEAYAKFQAEGSSETKATSRIGKFRRLRAPRRAIGRSVAAANLSTLSDQGFSRLSGSSRKLKLSAAAALSSVVVAALCVGIIYLVWTVYMDFQTIEVKTDSSQFADAGNSAVPETTVTLPSRIRQEPPKGFGVGTGIAELNPDSQGVYPRFDDDAVGMELAGADGLPAVGPDLGADEQTGLGEPLVEEPVKVVVVGSSDVWVRVYNQFDSDNIIKEGILKAGEEFIVPTDGGPFFLRTGLSSSTYFRIGAAVYGPVPSDGNSVVDKILLMTEAIVENFPHVEKIEASDSVRLYVFAEE